jgi:ubiquitin-associated protein 1
LFFPAQTSPVEDDFSKLSLKTQTLATQMGFRREMVLRAVERLGDNDKKIVEHLIPLSELIPLGFEEEKISEALIKFDNNKDRALDYLIS